MDEHADFPVLPRRLLGSWTGEGLAGGAGGGGLGEEAGLRSGQEGEGRDDQESNGSHGGHFMATLRRHNGWSVRSTRVHQNSGAAVGGQMGLQVSYWVQKKQ